MSKGPQAGIVINEHSRLCKKYMWRNFLFIHNFFGFENMVDFILSCQYA